MADRYFTIAQANRMVPRLERAFNRLIQLRLLMREVFDRLEATGGAPRDDDFEVAPEGVDPATVRDRASLKALMETFHDETRALEEAGCLIKGVEPGLVDWYARVDGRDVLLCWRHGEREVAWWHEVDAGFAGRQRIADLKRRTERSDDEG